MKNLYYLALFLLLGNSCFATQNFPLLEGYSNTSMIIPKQKMIESLKEVERDLAPESRIPGADPFMARSYIIANKDLIKKDLEIEQQAAQLLHTVIQKAPENFSKIPEVIGNSLNIFSWQNLLNSFQENQKHISLLPFSMRNTGFFSEDGLPSFNGCDYLTALNQYVDKTLSLLEVTPFRISPLENFLKETIQLAEKAAEHLKENTISSVSSAKDPTFDLEEDNWNFSSSAPLLSPEEIALYHHNFFTLIQESRCLLNKLSSKKIVNFETSTSISNMEDITL